MGMRPMTNRRPIPAGAKLIALLLGLAVLCAALVVIVGSIAAIAALLRYLLCI